MEDIFEKIFFLSTELSKMQEFCLFVKNVQNIAKCKEEKCYIEEFLKVLLGNLFNEDLSYDKRRKYFAEHSLKNTKVFMQSSCFIQKESRILKKLKT